MLYGMAGLGQPLGWISRYIGVVAQRVLSSCMGSEGGGRMEGGGEEGRGEGGEEGGRERGGGRELG